MNHEKCVAGSVSAEAISLSSGTYSKLTPSGARLKACTQEERIKIGDTGQKEVANKVR